MLFGLPFILAGVGFGVVFYLPMITSWWSARGWEEVSCWIEKAELKTTYSTKGGRSYHVEASYHYEFERRSYHGDQVSFFGGDNMGGFQEQAYQQLHALADKNRPFRCFVNPSKPEQVVLFRELRWGLLVLMSIFPTIFPLAGSAVSIGGWLQARKARMSQKLAAEYPVEPWRWRPEWADGTIRATMDGLPFILGVAGWILAVQLPLAIAGVFGGEIERSAIALFALLPASLALIPLGFAWQRMKSRWIIGRPTLQLKQLPISPGQVLAGELQFDRELTTLSTISVAVLCQRQITRSSGNSRTTAKETIWGHTETLSTALARRDINGVALPLRIYIPRGLPCSALDEASIVTTDGEEHVWTLAISSSQGGKPVVLPLPVFESAAGAGSVGTIASKECGDGFTLSTSDLVARLQARGIHAEFDPGGAPICIDCQAGRFRGLGVFLLIFGAFWSVVLMFMVWQGAPWIFRLVWGITSPLIIGAGFWTLLHSRRIEMAAGKLRILNRVGPFYSWSETFETHQFTGFTHDTNMQSGSQFFYRVRAETIFGKKKTLIDGITESLTAEVLEQRLEEWRKRE